MSSTDEKDMFEALEAELSVELIEWSPEAPGERIVGTIKTIEYVSIKDGAEMMGVLTLATPSGSLARVAAGAKNLRSQLESVKVQPGDGLAIQYEGQKEPKNGGRNYNAYRVATQARSPRDPSAAFKVPEGSEDLGLLPGAGEADPWAIQTDEAGR